MILLLPHDYPERHYPEGWAKKVIENNLFEFQKDLTKTAVCILNMNFTGKEDVNKINKNILNQASFSNKGIVINNCKMNGTYSKKIIEMIIKGEDGEKILNHAKIFSRKEGVPKEYKNHEFIAETLKY